MSDLTTQTALVTGAPRGLGREFVHQLLDRGIKRVYAAARNPDDVVVTDDRIVPILLDVTNDEHINNAAAFATDVTLLINNAGIGGGGSVLDVDQTLLRRHMETNFYAPLRIASAFADHIEDNGGGTILNVHSVLSWLAIGGTYSASKAAFWSATNSMRLELHPRNIHVIGLHVGYVDTDMTARITADKVTPESVVAQALDAVQADDHEVLADQQTREVKQALAGPIADLYPQLRVAP